MNDIIHEVRNGMEVMSYKSLCEVTGGVKVASFDAVLGIYQGRFEFGPVVATQLESVEVERHVNAISFQPFASLALGQMSDNAIYVIAYGWGVEQTERLARDIIEECGTLIDVPFPIFNEKCRRQMVDMYASITADMHYPEDAGFLFSLRKYYNFLRHVKGLSPEDSMQHLRARFRYEDGDSLQIF